MRLADMQFPFSVDLKVEIKSRGSACRIDTKHSPRLDNNKRTMLRRIPYFVSTRHGLIPVYQTHSHQATSRSEANVWGLFSSGVINLMIKEASHRSGVMGQRKNSGVFRCGVCKWRMALGLEHLIKQASICRTLSVWQLINSDAFNSVFAAQQPREGVGGVETFIFWNQSVCSVIKDTRVIKKHYVQARGQASAIAVCI